MKCPLLLAVVASFSFSSLVLAQPVVLEKSNDVERWLSAAQISIHATEIIVNPSDADSLKSGETEALRKIIAKLKKENRAEIVARVRAITLDKQPVELHTKTQQPSETGRSSGGQKSYNYQQTGTVFTCVAEQVEDRIFLDYAYDKSEMIDRGDDAPPMLVSTGTKGIARLANGRSIVVSGQRIGNDSKPVQWVLVLEASVLED